MTPKSSRAKPVPPCCPLPPGVTPLTAAPASDDETLSRLARWAHALSDPVRLRMLEVMATATDCCRPGSPADAPDAPAGDASRGADSVPAGVCVCELQSLQGLAQSTVSYHLKVLRDAGLVREERRGKWTFYAVDRDAAAELTEGLRRHLRV